MSFKTNGYSDMNVWRSVRNQQKRKYFSKTSIYERRSWTEVEDALVLFSDLTDTALSAEIRRSVSAIQKRRWKLKNDNILGCLV